MASAGWPRGSPSPQRHLHRLLVAELGTGPLALARTVRLQTARRLLAETSLPITDIAFASGFSSVRQFNATVLESSGRTPSQLRAAARGAGRGAGQAADGPGTWLTLRLACREPYDAAALLDFLAVRAVPGVEQVSAGRYSRTVRTAGGAGLIELLPRPGQGHVLLRARLGKLSGVGPLVSRCPAAAGRGRRPGRDRHGAGRRRPDRAAGPGPARASGYRAATTASNWPSGRSWASRCRWPRPARSPPGWPPGTAPRCPRRSPRTRPQAGEPGPHLLFPGPEDLAGADLTGLGPTAGRQRTLDALAAAAASGRLDLSLGADPEETAARLAELPGIGPWTISYIMLRTGADPDGFPASDLGLRRALARLGAPPGHPGRWRPWRGYAAVHLWTWEAAATGADHPVQPGRPPGTRPLAAGRDGRSGERISASSQRGAVDA